MTYMDIEFPGDVQEARIRDGRNISNAERWGSMAAGVGLAAYGLSRRRGAGWALTGLGALLFQRGFSGFCHTYQVLGINTAGTGDDTRRALGSHGGVLVEESVTINQPIELLYRFWRNLENLPRFMRHLESVERVTDTLSRWRAKGPGGSIVEWNAEIINEVPSGHRWRSSRGIRSRQRRISELRRRRSGPGTRGPSACSTALRVERIGAAVAKLMGRDPGSEIRQDLQQFKQVLESGDVPPISLFPFPFPFFPFPFPAFSGAPRTARDVSDCAETELYS